MAKPPPTVTVTESSSTTTGAPPQITTWIVQSQSIRGALAAFLTPLLTSILPIEANVERWTNIITIAVCVAFIVHGRVRATGPLTMSKPPVAPPQPEVVHTVSIATTSPSSAPAPTPDGDASPARGADGRFTKEPPP